MPSFPCSHHPKGPKSHSAQINNLTTELSPDGKDATGRFRENPIFSNTIGSAGGPIFHVHIGNPGGGMCGRRSGGGSRVGLSSCKSRLVDCYVGTLKKNSQRCSASQLTWLHWFSKSQMCNLDEDKVCQICWSCPHLPLELRRQRTIANSVFLVSKCPVRAAETAAP